MPEPQPGDFFVAQITGWTGLGIRVLQWLNGDASKWTHAGILMPNGRVFEAEPGGAANNPLSEYAGRPLKWSTNIVELTDEERKAVLFNALQLLGVGYGWGTYFYLACYRIGIRPKWLKDRVQSSQDMICSQLVDEVYNRSGKHLFNDGRLPQNVTPADLNRLLDYPAKYAYFY